MKISIIAAMGENRELGANGGMLWHLPDDLKHFKNVTRGHGIIMGRKTYESIGRPLPERKNIIVTRDPDYHAEGCVTVHSIEDALAAAKGDDEVFVIGGGEIYRQALPFAREMILTLVDGTSDSADTYFPEVNDAHWRIVAAERHEKDDRHAYGFTIKTYEKKEA